MNCISGLFVLHVVTLDADSIQGFKSASLSNQNINLRETINMMNTTTPRRSQRLASKKKSTSVSVTKSSSHKSLTASSTLIAKTEYRKAWLRHKSSSVSSIDLDLIESKLATQYNSAGRKLRSATKPSAAHFIADSASSSDYSTDFETFDEEESEDEYGELADLSADNFEWGAAHNVDAGRNNSYDSRYEPGNEDYETDEFVVRDDEDIVQWSDSDEEVEEDAKEKGDDDRCDPENTVEMRRSSNESKLFFSDPEDTSNPLALPLWSGIDFRSEGIEAENEPLIAEASEEIVEEILDALALFSRRCNRNRQPIRLKLSAGALEDREVKEALESALKLGLGRKFSLENGNKRWVIGPKGV